VSLYNKILCILSYLKKKAALMTVWTSKESPNSLLIPEDMYINKKLTNSKKNLNKTLNNYTKLYSKSSTNLMTKSTEALNSIINDNHQRLSIKHKDNNNNKIKNLINNSTLNTNDIRLVNYEALNLYKNFVQKSVTRISYK
jgi:hypothetical protein